MATIGNKTKEAKVKYKDIICNGFSCDHTNTTRINVDAGKFGKIELWLCPSCAKKFR